MMRFGLLAASLLLGAAAPEAPPTPPTPDRTAAAFGDWEMRCDMRPLPAPGQATPTPATPTKVCELIQAVFDKQHRPVLSLAVKPAAGAEAFPVLLVQMPVNVLIAGETAFAFAPGTPVVPIKLQFCVAAGCFASVELTAPLREKLAAWGDKPASFTFVSAAQTHVQVPVSWRGFAQALAAMERPVR